MSTLARLAAPIAALSTAFAVTPDVLAGGIVRFENIFGPCSPSSDILGPGDFTTQGVAFDTPDFQNHNFGANLTVFESDSVHVFTFGAGTKITFPQAVTKVRFRAAAKTPQVAYPSFKLFANGAQVTTFACDIFHVTEVAVVLPVATDQITIQFIGGSSSGLLLDDLTYGDVIPGGCDSYWPMTPIANPLALDDALGGNDGTLVNGAAPTAGVFGSAIQFDGIDDYCEMPDSDSLDIGASVPGTAAGDFSLAMWIKTTIQFTTPVLDKRQEYSGPVTGYHAYVYQGRMGLQLADGVHSNWNSTAYVADGAWHHVAITIDRDQTDGIRFYLDGAFTGVTYDPTPRSGSLANAFPLRLGTRSDSSGAFDGTLDEVVFCRRVLTPGEVAGLVAGQLPPSAWTKIGSAKAGSLGLPDLTGSGPLATNANANLHLANAKPGAAALLVIAVTETPTPFIGGTLRPFPIVLTYNAFPAISLGGTYDFPFLVPPGLPSQSPLYFQWIIQDSGATNGVALSNALEGWIP